MGFQYSRYLNEFVVREVFSWKFHTSKPSSDANNPVNFTLLNKKSAMDGMVTAPQFKQFRKEHDVRIPFGVSALKSHNRGISLPNEGFTYGRANRPQTPIMGIIGNNFGEAAGANLQDRYRQMKLFKK